MARRGRKGGGGNPVATIILGLLGAFIAVVIAVEGGGWAMIAPSLGLPPVTSIKALYPTEKDQKKAIRQLPKPPAATSGESSDIKSMLEREKQRLHSDRAAAPNPDGAKATVTLPAAASSPYSVGKALQVAENMPVATPHAKGYDRIRQFGTWADSDEMCGRASTRDQILKRDMTDVGMDSQCRVTHGDFTDPYTGKQMKFTRGKTTSGLIQIDHVVALNDAWASGMYKRSQSERVKYANDPDVLLASEGVANNLKGNGINLKGEGGDRKWHAGTPSVWLPDYQPYRCAYMAKRVYIKDKYRLTMSSWEKRETVAYLKACPAQ